LCDTPQNKEPRTGPHHIWCIYTLCLFFGRKRTHTAAQLRSRFRLPVFIMTTLEPQNICSNRTCSSNQCGGRAILALSSFFNQIPHQKGSEISLGIFSPREGNSIQLLSTVRSRKWKNFCGCLKVTSTHQRAVSHTITIAEVTHAPFVPFHNMRFHGAVAVVTKFPYASFGPC